MTRDLGAMLRQMAHLLASEGQLHETPRMRALEALHRDAVLLARDIGGRAAPNPHGFPTWAPAHGARVAEIQSRLAGWRRGRGWES